MVWGVAQWTDGPLFDLVLRIVLAVSHDGMPCDFAGDRGQLYFGDVNALADLQAELPANINQLRGHMSWVEKRLSGKRQFVLGNQPGLPDTLNYYLIWLMKERWPGFDDFFSEFPNLVSWENKMRALGHGQPTDMTAEQALTIARDASPTTTQAEDPRDPLGLRPGDMVSVTHRGAGEDPAVVGRMIRGDADMIALAIESPDLGDLAIHFPKVGYHIERV